MRFCLVRTCAVSQFYSSTRLVSLVWLGVLWLTFCAGCGGGDGLNRQAVSGKFTVDGKPLPNGSVSFQPLGASGGVGSGAVVSEGKFSISQAEGLPPGKYLVTATGDDGTNFGVSQGKMPGDEIMPPKKELIPGNWKQEIEVKDGSNEFDFVVDSSAKKKK